MSKLIKLIRNGCLTLGLGFALAFGGAGAASADFINGQQLRLYCTSQDPNDEAVCFVYIAGAVDAFTTVDLMAAKTHGTKRQFCLPDGVSPDDLKDVVLKWLQREEANLDLAATLLVMGAIKNGYACS